jgi:hypothetical protein
MRRIFRRVAFLAVLAVASGILLIAPGAATASHGSYWFYRGYLPTSDGTRTVHHANVCCETYQWIRMSWECNTHDMNFVAIQYGGSWDFFNASWWECDTYAGYHSGFYARGGCQNPPRSGYYTVWTNCRVGNSVY